MSDAPVPPRRTSCLVWCGVLGLVGGGLILLLIPALQQARSGVGPPKSMRPLRQVGIALQGYATVQGGWIPAGGTRDAQEPAASWQTQLLPHIDRPDLFHAIDFDQPWNAAANVRVFATKIPQFVIPGEPKAAAVAGCAATQQAANSRLLRTDRGWNLDDLARGDGTAYTIMIGEVGSALSPWGRPGNSRDPAAGIGTAPDQFGRSHGKFAYFVFAGGNARLIESSVSPRVMELLADPENGVPLTDDF